MRIYAILFLFFLFQEHIYSEIVLNDLNDINKDNEINGNGENVDVKQIKLLEEVVIEAKYEFQTDEKKVYIPDKRAKKMAWSGISLLSSMAIPSLNVNIKDETVSTITGLGVEFYVDFNQVDKDFIKNLRPMDVKRIEVYENPSDIRFKGAMYVVNFLMKEYRVGGYSKVDGSQTIIENRGVYSVFSKFSVGKHSFDLSLGYSYINSLHDASDLFSDYRFTDYDLNTCIWSDVSRVKNDKTFIVGRVLNNLNRVKITNSIGFSFDYIPHEFRNNYQKFIPSLYSDSEVNENNKRIGRNFNWNGNIYMDFGQGWTMNVDPYVGYSSNNINSRYVYDSSDFIIENDIEEKAVESRLVISLDKKLGIHSVSFFADGKLQFNDIRYSGSFASNERSKTYWGGGRIKGDFIFGKFRLSGNIGLYANHSSFGDFKNNQPTVNMFISGTHRIGNYHSLNLSTEMSYWGLALSLLNPNKLYTSFLDAVEGNPDLRMARYNAVTLQYSGMLSNIFNIGAYVQWTGLDNPAQYSYTPVKIDSRQVMLRSCVNSGFLSQVRYGGNLSVMLPDRSLRGMIGLSGQHYRRHGINYASADFITINCQVQYSIGNVYFMGFWNSKNRTLSQFQDLRMPASYGLIMGYGNGNLNVNIAAYNFLSSSWECMRDTINNSNFRQERVIYGYGRHRNFTISLSYSFSYGKKIEKGVDVGNVNVVGSGVLM